MSARAGQCFRLTAVLVVEGALVLVPCCSWVAVSWSLTSPSSDFPPSSLHAVLQPVPLARAALPTPPALATPLLHSTKRTIRLTLCSCAALAAVTWDLAAIWRALRVRCGFRASDFCRANAAGPYMWLAAGPSVVGRQALLLEVTSAPQALLQHKSNLIQVVDQYTTAEYPLRHGKDPAELDAAPEASQALKLHS